MKTPYYALTPDHSTSGNLHEATNHLSSGSLREAMRSAIAFELCGENRNILKEVRARASR